MYYSFSKDGKLKLMESVYWEYDKLPHMLIAGGTGGGKTYFILTIIEALLHTSRKLYILDPKNADIADLETVMPNVYYKKQDMRDCITTFFDEYVSQTVQKLRETKRRLIARQDTIPLFSGLLFCADCNRKLNFARGKTVTTNQENYLCSYIHEKPVDLEKLANRLQSYLLSPKYLYKNHFHL